MKKLLVVVQAEGLQKEIADSAGVALVAAQLEHTAKEVVTDDGLRDDLRQGTTRRILQLRVGDLLRLQSGTEEPVVVESLGQVDKGGCGPGAARDRADVPRSLQ